MKTQMKYLFAIAAISLASCTAIDNSTDESVTIKGMEQEMRFEALPTSPVSFTIESNRNWVISIQDLDWIRVSSMKGKGTGKSETILIDAIPNNGAERTGELTLTAGNTTFKAMLVQEAANTVPEFKAGSKAINLQSLGSTSAVINVCANIEWTARTEGLEWARVTPLHGLRNRTVTISIMAEDNYERQNRSGAIYFSAPDMETYTVNVTQDGFTTILSANEEEVVLNSKVSPATFDVRSNVQWSASYDADWFTISPANGEGRIDASPETITVTPLPNLTGAVRNATITIVSDDSSVEPVIVNVMQKAKGEEVLLARWTMTKDHIRTNRATFTKSGSTLADLPEGTAANAAWTYTDYKPTYMLRDDSSYSHYCIKKVWTNDCMEFTIPVRNFEAGTTVRFHFSVQHSGPKLLIVEYFDGKKWTPTSSQLYTAPDGTKIEVTKDLGNTQGALVEFDEKVTFYTDIPDGTIKFRVRNPDGRILGSKTGESIITEPGDGVLRFRQGNTEAHMSFYMQ